MKYFRAPGDKAVSYTRWREGTSSETAVSTIAPEKDQVYPFSFLTDVCLIGS